MSGIDQSPIANVELIIDARLVGTTDEKGAFNLSEYNGEQIILFKEQYQVIDTLITTPTPSPVTIYMNPLSLQLTAVEIEARRKELYAIRQLKDVEGMTINSGKKTEVVVLENIVGNLAVNQSRQIYAQVAGLNIYEGSGGGLQLAIGGRGLDPNRTANFNTRQNNYDISADVLGYPESYYTPPAQAIREVQIIRGASSLQYGTQFGGLINFKINDLEKGDHWGLRSSQTYGSFNLFDSYNQIGYQKDKLSINAYYNFKRGDGYRANSDFKAHNLFAQIHFEPTPRSSLKAEMTYYHYLAKQAGGLTDQMFSTNPRQSNRERNWFAVDWRLYNLNYEQEISSTSKISFDLFGLHAQRNALGYRGNPVNLNENPILSLDEKDLNGNYINPRDLIKSTFQNYGAEFRFIHEMNIAKKQSVWLSGLKWYDADNTSTQGPGSFEKDANFTFIKDVESDYPAQSEFTFPNYNLAFFTENVLYLNDKLSITPGLRFEYISTGAEGTYNQVIFDNAGNPIANNTFDEDRLLKRHFVLLGLGIDYKPNPFLNVFANLSQNYRSITFSDIRVVSPSFIIDPDITDEKGFTFDLGIRGRKNRLISYNMGMFGVLYQNRIGIIFDDRANRVRKNIGDAQILGLELLVDTDIIQFHQHDSKLKIKPYLNLAYTYSEYIRSESQNVKGKKVEFVPVYNLKAGLVFQYKGFRSSLQYTYLSEQFTDAQNSPIAQNGDLRSGIIGEIPAYGVTDLSLSYKYKYYTITSGINNLFDSSYYTRRATGYPGPGIIPSDGRNFYLGIMVDLKG